jgi:glycosyltransferase involved in cell wall biosynthesis
LGRINWKKGLDILAKAYGRIARQREDVHLLIVGNDESGYEKRVKRWLKEERVLDKVTFTGMLTGKEKLRAYTASDIFVLPSYSENFGMSVIEAMACGIPVVISDQVGIHREVSANNAGVIVECNEESVGKGVKSILDNKNFAEELSFNAKKMVREYYSIDNVADKMIETYRQILNA